MKSNELTQTGAEGQREWAVYLANQLGEPHLLNYYERLVSSYPLESIKQALDETTRYPKAQILKSRAALFKYLLNRYAQSDSK